MAGWWSWPMTSPLGRVFGYHLFLALFYHICMQNLKWFDCCWLAPFIKKVRLPFLQLPYRVTISPIHFSTIVPCISSHWHCLFLFVCFSLFYFDIHSTPKMITPHLSDSSLSLSVSHLCSRCMKGHDHRCHTHMHTMLKIMRLFWEYYNAGNNTDNDDDNSTTSVTFFDRTGWVFI